MYQQSHSVSIDGYCGYNGRHVFIVNVWDYAKIQPLVWLMSSITYPGKLTRKLLTHMMKIWSLL